MSVAVINLPHAVDAYINLDTTTARDSSCNPTSDSPCCRRTRRAHSVCMLSLTTLRMWYV